MSFCAVNMQKYNAGALGGLQSHNQRERESRKNREIDPEKTCFNYDTVDNGYIEYHAKVKARIDELNLKRAVRKDAVVFCSFIVSSDQEFFRHLGRIEHIRRENEKEMVAIGLREPSDFEECDPAYQADCIAAGARPFFRDATTFFQRRFGKENVINGTVHVDEPGAAHMHLGVVPIVEGRLSAKALFTPETLRQLQTDFAAEVGEKYGLVRGREGSEAKHIDEVTFKLKQREAALESVTKILDEKKWELQNASQELQEARQGVEAINERVEGLAAEEKALAASVGDLREEVTVLQEAAKREYNAGARLHGHEWERHIADERQRTELIKKVEKLESRLNLYEQFMQSIPGLWQRLQAWLAERLRGQAKDRKRSQPSNEGR